MNAYAVVRYCMCRSWLLWCRACCCAFVMQSMTALAASKRFTRLYGATSKSPMSIRRRRATTSRDEDRNMDQGRGRGRGTKEKLLVRRQLITHKWDLVINLGMRSTSHLYLYPVHFIMLVYLFCYLVFVWIYGHIVHSVDCTRILCNFIQLVLILLVAIVRNMFYNPEWYYYRTYYFRTLMILFSYSHSYHIVIIVYFIWIQDSIYYVMYCILQ